MIKHADRFIEYILIFFSDTIRGDINISRYILSEAKDLGFYGSNPLSVSLIDFVSTYLKQ